MRKAGKGFTVVEVLVAIAIFTALLVPVMSMFSGTVNTATFTEDYLTAFLLAQKEIENIKYQAQISKTSLQDLVGNLTEQTEEGKYKIQYSVELDKKVAASSQKGAITVRLAEVVVTVKWKEGRRENSVSLSTLIDKVYF